MALPKQHIFRTLPNSHVNPDIQNFDSKLFKCYLDNVLFKFQMERAHICFCKCKLKKSELLVIHSFTTFRTTLVFSGADIEYKVAYR